MDHDIDNLKNKLIKLKNENKKLRYRNKLESEVNMELARRLDRVKSEKRDLLVQIEGLKGEINGYIASCTDAMKVKVQNSLSLTSSKCHNIAAYDLSNNE